VVVPSSPYPNFDILRRKCEDCGGGFLTDDPDLVYLDEALTLRELSLILAKQE
jgi:hypothetical protein